MKSLITAVALTACGTVAAVALAIPASAAPTLEGGQGGAVFAATDNPAGNQVIAFDRAGDGSLVQAGSYATGGLGGVLGDSAVDHTASQGAVAYDQQARLLYTVNAGSDTITTFSVIGDKLVRGQVISSGGDFPVSITTHNNLVYVLNARDGGSVQGYLQVAGRLVLIRSWHRALGLDPDQTPEFTSTPGQVAFTPEGTGLVVTTKNGANTVDVFPIGPLGPSAKPAVTALPGAVPFAVAFDAAGHLALAEAGPNAVATFSVNRDGTLTPLDSSPTGQTATCWVAAADGKLYLSNAGSGTVSGYRVARNGTLDAVGATTSGPGSIDLAASPDGRILYVRTGQDGDIRSYRINPDATLTPLGSVTVPGAAGGEGIVVS